MKITHQSSTRVIIIIIIITIIIIEPKIENSHKPDKQWNNENMNSKKRDLDLKINHI